MWWAVDLLASAYGWSKADILENVYLDELFVLAREINRRKLSEYKMQLAIATNPHVKDNKKLWDMFDEQERLLNGGSSLDERFDAVGFENFKNALKRQGGSIIVK